MRYNISYIVLGISIMTMSGLATDFGSQFNAAANIGYNKTGLTSIDMNLDYIASLKRQKTNVKSIHHFYLFFNISKML